VLECELINWVFKEENFITFLKETLNHRGFHQVLLILTGNEVDVILTSLRSLNVIIERSELSHVAG
jgi:uncharacterized protein YbcV (DUF1398 family)